jgi:glutathione peroxidase
MTRLLTVLAIAAAVTGFAFAATAGAADEKTTPAANAPVPEVLKFKMKDIDENEVDLAKFQGKVIMMMNVASYCGNTPQYTGLEALYQKYKDKGFVILAFPANQFGAQEPGTDKEIKEFCTEGKYHVTFPLFSKSIVKGDGITPLFKYLTAVDTKPQPKGDITWNFEKFLVGRDGKVLARFKPATLPDDKALVAAIESALAAK